VIYLYYIIVQIHQLFNELEKNNIFVILTIESTYRWRTY